MKAAALERLSSRVARELRADPWRYWAPPRDFVFAGWRH